MTWITDLIDGHVRLWEQRRLKDAAANPDRILIRMFEGKFPIALFLDKQKQNGEYQTHCLAGPHADATLQRFMEQLEPVEEKNDNAVSALLAELRQRGYNPVIVVETEARTDNSQDLSKGKSSNLPG